MINDLNIIDGVIVTSERIIKAGIGIKDGKIVSISKEEDLFPAREVLSVKDCIIMPGMIDSHVHIREPGFNHREDFQTGTAAAAAGGVTTIAEMPVSRPPTSDIDTLLMRIKLANKKSYIDFSFYAGAGTSNIEKIEDLAKCGVVGFKTFLMPPPEGREQEFYGLCSSNWGSFRKILGVIKKTGLFLAIHAEDNEIIDKETKRIKNFGGEDLEAFSHSRPPISEIQAIRNVIESQKLVNTKISICHVSTPESIEIIKKAKEKGLDIHAETCPQYLFLNEEKARKFGSFARVKPPIRKESLRKKLWSQFRNGLVDIISSDHAPYLPSEKEKSGNNIWLAPDGIPGLELSLPLLLNKVSDNEITYHDIVKYFSENPAKLLGLYPVKGSLEIGTDADLAIIKPDVKSKISLNDLWSKSKESAKVYENWALSHKIIYTICRGKIVFDKGKIIGQPGYGNYISPLKDVKA